MEYDVNQSTGDEGLEERNGQGVELLDDDLTGTESDRCSCTDGKQGCQSRDGACRAPHKPPDREPNRQTVQYDTEAEGGGSRIGVVVSGGCEGCGVDEGM